MPQVGNDVHATVFDLGRLRVLILVDHVFVEGIGHQLLHFGLDPGGAEGRQVLPGIAVQQQFVAHQVVGDKRRGRVIREAIFGQLVLGGATRINVCDGWILRLYRFVKCHNVLPLTKEIS